MNDNKTVLNVAKLEKSAQELGVPASFFQKVLGLSNSTISYWKTGRDGRIPEKYQQELVEIIISLKYIHSRKRLIPATGEEDADLRDAITLLNSANVLLKQKQEMNPMISSARDLMNSSLDILRQKIHDK